MKNFLQIFTSGGLSGDMFLAAFTDLGFPLSYLKEQLKKISGLPKLNFEINKITKSDIVCKHLKILLPQDDKHHRTYKTIKILIESSKLSSIVKKNSLAVFHLLAKAECKVHDKELDQIHFHEVGSLDSIIDIVGFCIAVEYLKIEKIYCEELIFGTGLVSSAHGLLPEPVPAVLEICKDLPFHTNTNNIGEMITPTGAALVAHFADFSNTVQNKKNTHLAYGAGSRNYNFPNILRLLMGEEDTHTAQNINLQATQTNKIKEGYNNFFEKDKHIQHDKLYILECNIDDMNPQIYDSIFEKALKKVSVLDIWLTRIQMKKNRPAQKLSILCEEKVVEQAGLLLLEETTSLGFRLSSVERYSIIRKQSSVTIGNSKIRIKIAELENGTIKIYPEYDDCKKYSLEQNISLLKVIDMVKNIYFNSL